MSSLSSSATLPAPPPHDPRLRAGRVLLFLGVLEIVLFGLATFAVLRAAGMTIPELQDLTGANLTLDQLRSVHPQLKSFAILLALSGLIPGALYVICSIGLQRGLTPPVYLALVLAATQLFALGGILLRQLLIALAQGDPPGMTVNVLAFGTPMAFLVFVIRCLFQTRTPRRTPAPT